MRIMFDKWFTYDDGIAHITKLVGSDDTFWWEMESRYGEHYEMSACGKVNKFVYGTAKSNVPRCELCENVQTMLKLAE